MLLVNHLGLNHRYHGVTTAKGEKAYLEKGLETFAVKIRRCHRFVLIREKHGAKVVVFGHITKKKKICFLVYHGQSSKILFIFADDNLLADIDKIILI